VGHSKIVAALALAALCASGCASLRWSLAKSLRQPGEALADFPEEVWAEYDCDKQRRPFFAIEENELVPPRVRAGGEFNHRLVYVLCPARPTGVISGRLHTRIRFRGDPIVRETTEAYELKPGRWVVDAEVQLPSDAEPGVYAYEVAFESAPVGFEKRLTFVVQSR
jgi:hypothetical protein